MSNDSSLGSLGLDSLMSVEVKQVLEREFDLVLSMKEIRALTITSLRQKSIQASAGESKEEKDSSSAQQSEKGLWFPGYFYCPLHQRSDEWKKLVVMAHAKCIYSLHDVHKYYNITVLLNFIAIMFIVS